MKGRTIFIFLACLIVGFSLTIQARMTNGQHLYVSAKVVEDLQTTIDSEYKDMENIRQLIEDTADSLKEYENPDTTAAEFREKLQQEVDYYRMMTGIVDAHGEGVEVTVDDGTRPLYEGEDPNNVLVHDADLLTIVNELKSAGAEVIAINGQRIANNTEISCSGYTVRINDQFYARPFKIEAIGDAKRMASVLVAPGGYGTLLKDYGLTFVVEIKDDIKIRKIETLPLYRYMKKAG